MKPVGIEGEHPGPLKRRAQTAGGRHAAEQIVRKLREAEFELAKGQSIKAVPKKRQITDPTCPRWRKEYGGLQVNQTRRVADLEREPGRGAGEEAATAEGRHRDPSQESGARARDVTDSRGIILRMAYIRLVPVGKATGLLKTLYDAAIRRAGKVFNIVRTMSPNPPVLEASMELYRRIMFGPSGLSRREREMLAVVVSRANECGY